MSFLYRQRHEKFHNLTEFQRDNWENKIEKNSQNEFLEFNELCDTISTKIKIFKQKNSQPRKSYNTVQKLIFFHKFTAENQIRR